MQEKDETHLNPLFNKGDRQSNGKLLFLCVFKIDSKATKVGTCPFVLFAGEINEQM